MSVLLAQLDWIAPMRLVALALIPAMVLLGWFTLRNRAGRLRLISLLLRLMVLLALAVAWAGPRWLGLHSETTFVVLEDVSRSVPDVDGEAVAASLRQQLSGRSVRQISFATQPTSLHKELPAALDEIPTDNTNVEEALLLAKAVMPGGHNGGILLASDGLETRGSAVSVVGDKELPISVRTLNRNGTVDAAIATIRTPTVVAPHERLPVVVEIISTTASTAELQLSRDGRSVKRQPLDLKAGLTELALELDPPTEGPVTIRAMVTIANDAAKENNAAEAVVLPGMARSILLVTDDEGGSRTFANLLSGFGYGVEVATAVSLDDTVSFSSDDLVVLSNVTSADLGDAGVTELQKYVEEQGGGLLVMGGERAFGVEALKLTRLESLLPVVAVEEPEEKQKSLAMVLVIDKSLSMLDDRRLELAKEAAKQVAGVLTETDQVGVLAFGSETQWISQLAPLTNRKELLQRIDGLQAKGLTNMYPALLRAYLALSQTEADSRNVILLTDGVPTPGEFRELAKQMADANITVSTVSLSAGADQTILKDIASAAQGSHHHADDPEALPQILVRETQQAVSQVSGEKFRVKDEGQWPELSLAGAPDLSAYSSTQAKDGAVVLASVADSDPLLVAGSVGEGNVVAFTADLFEEQGTAWNSWPGQQELWRQVVRRTLRAPQPKALHLDVRTNQDQVVATLDAFKFDTAGKRAFWNNARGTLKVMPNNSSSGDGPRELDFEQVAPGRYQTAWPRENFTSHVLKATLSGSGSDSVSIRRGYCSNYPDEFRVSPPNIELLTLIADATGGEIDGNIESLPTSSDAALTISQPWWPWAIMCAIVFFLADVAVYRRGLSTFPRPKR